jgi:hypothetical protein
MVAPSAAATAAVTTAIMFQSLGSGQPWCSKYGGRTLGSYENIYACQSTSPDAGDDPPFGSGYGGIFQCTELADRFLYNAKNGDTVDDKNAPDQNLTGANFVYAVHSAYPNILVEAQGPGSLPAAGDIISMWGGSSGQSDELTSDGHVAVVTAVTHTGTGWVVTTLNEDDESDTSTAPPAPGSKHQGDGFNYITVSSDGLSWSFNGGYFTQFEWLELSQASSSSPSMWSQSGEVKANAQYNYLGSSVAIDGDTAVAEADSRTAVGAVYVYNDRGGTWVTQARLSALGISGPVALSGQTLLVGDSSRDAVNVYAESDAQWVNQVVLSDPDKGANDEFGSSLGVSGTTAIVGDGEIGDAFMFHESGGKWQERARLLPSDGAPGDCFGCSVAISGNTAVVGAPWHAVNGNSALGAVYVFQSTGGTWRQTAELEFSDELELPHGSTNYDFGYRVGISGREVIAGTPGTGAAYIFSDKGKTWAQQKLTDGVSGDAFGGPVAISGNTAIVGAIGHGPGSVYVFSSSTGTWRQVSELTPADPTSQPGGQSEQFGYAIAVSGVNVTVSANLAYNYTSTGRVYFYSEQ